MGFRISTTAACLLVVATGTWALDADTFTLTGLKNASSIIAGNIISRYGNYSGQIPGLFNASQTDQVYFWDDGLAWDALIYYYGQTGDTQYNDIVRLAMEWQESPTLNYMPPNQSKSEGNDDQATWGLAAMTAAEQGFPEPAGNATYLQLAQNVFDSQAARWDNQTCGGGLRWQIFSFNTGYDYKNSLSNGDFFQLASRLARFTGNSTYYEWAERAYSWSKQIGLVTNQGQVFDGTATTGNCSQINHIQWTANAGAYINGMAYLKNSSFANASANNGAVADLSTLVQASLTIFTNWNSFIYEPACQPEIGPVTCSTDQWAFRSLFVRSLATVQYVGLDSNTTAWIKTALEKTAQLAAAECTGGPNGTSCGASWTARSFDDRASLQSDTSALNLMLANIPLQRIADHNTTTTTTNSSSSSGIGTGTGTTNGNASGTTSAGSSTAYTGAGSTLVGSMGMLAALAAAVVIFA